jgi:glycosyltransferase involved in cell wall biosynthesis
MIWAAFHQGEINHVTGDVNYLGLLMRRPRTILTIHDSASMERLDGWRRRLYSLIWLRLPVWHAARVTVISKSTLEETLSFLGTGRSKIVLIPNCTTHEIVGTPRVFSVTDPRFLVVGTKANKNLLRITAALKGIPCRLVVVGELSDVHRKAIDENALCVENHFNVSDAEIAALYQKADAVLFVSTYEGFGLPILEAQAAGTPLITSRRAPMQDVAGPGSCLVDPEDVADIRRAVLRVLYDEAYRLELVRTGTENVRHYLPETIAARYAFLYEQAAAGDTV